MFSDMIVETLQKTYLNVEFIKYDAIEEIYILNADVKLKGKMQLKIVTDYQTKDDIMEQIKYFFSNLFNEKSIKKIVKYACKNYNKIEIKNEIITDSCCICFEDYINNKIIYNCGHSVCGCCSKKIIICPYCRKDTRTDLYEIIKLIIKNYDDDDDETLEEQLNKVFDFNNFIENEIYEHVLTFQNLQNIVVGRRNLKHVMEDAILYFEIMEITPL